MAPPAPENVTPGGVEPLRKRKAWKAQSQIMVNSSLARISSRVESPVLVTELLRIIQIEWWNDLYCRGNEYSPLGSRSLRAVTCPF